MTRPMIRTHLAFKKQTDLVTKQLTMYLATGSHAERDILNFNRHGVDSLTAWSSTFRHLTTTHQNEVLLGALVKAEESGLCVVADENRVYLFVQGDFPALSMSVPVSGPVPDLTNKTSVNELSERLAHRRIAYTPQLFHGYFVNGDGEVFKPNEDEDVQYGATTEQAVEGLFDDDLPVDFFGEEIRSHSKRSAFGVI
jgi:hypothetical protein